MPSFQFAVYGMLGVVALWTLSFTLTNLLTCYPVTPLIEAFYGNKCMDTIPMWLSVVITDLIVDVAILCMPVPMVLQLHLPCARDWLFWACSCSVQRKISGLMMVVVLYSDEKVLVEFVPLVPPEWPL